MVNVWKNWRVANDTGPKDRERKNRVVIYDFMLML